MVSSMFEAASVEPRGELCIRILAMPANTNPNGDIFGGWVVSMMDLAGTSIAKQHAPDRIATVAIDKMVFIAPVKVGDFVCCYGEVVRRGRTSIAINIETWAVGANQPSRRKVTEGVFTYVAIDQHGSPTPLIEPSEP